MIETYDIRKPNKKKWLVVVLISLLTLFLIVTLLRTTFRPSREFPINESVVIPRGLTASQIASVLEEKKVVRSSTLLYIVLQLRHDPNTVQAGTFIFDEPLSVFEVANRITESGITGNLATVTLPEGFTIKEFADIASLSLSNFDADTFVKQNAELEGYLFPDTYYVPADFTADEFSTLLKSTYVEKTKELKENLEAHPLGEAGVISMASLIEREANTDDSMKMVAGILQNRLQAGMRLQADASLEYVLGRPLNTLSAEDLEIDSPYNTYLYDGLPPTPIGNPGLQAIKAVLEPTPSDYYYYITDEEGNFHYAKTFEEHRQNITKYLQ